MSDAPGSANRNDAAWPERLRAERERRGLDREQVAEDLHVDVWIIEALEVGQFSSLGAPVYARGHLRKYAELLGLDAAELMASFERHSARPPELVPITPARSPRPGVSMRMLGAVVVAGIVIGTAWWALAERDDGVPAPAPRMAPSEKAATAEAVEPVDAGPSIPAPAAAEEAPAEFAPQAAEGQVADVAPPGTPVRLRLSFSVDCWVELYDAGGQRVFFDLGPANSVRSVTAAAPLQVFLGYADGVQLELNGKQVELPAHVRRGDTARFSVDARGQVR